MNSPIELQYLNYVSQGKINYSNQIVQNEDLLNEKLNIGEIFDLFCVINDKKDLAALDFSLFGRKKLKKLNYKKINKVINYANDNNVKLLHNNKRGGMYLKSIFFKEYNIQKAINLMGILWYSEKYCGSNSEFHYMIGKLLGYKHDNIIYFILKTTGIKLTPYLIDLYDNNLNELNIKLEDLQEKYDIKLYNVIDKL